MITIGYLTRGQLEFWVFIKLIKSLNLEHSRLIEYIQFTKLESVTCPFNTINNQRSLFVCIFDLLFFILRTCDHWQIFWLSYSASSSDTAGMLREVFSSHPGPTNEYWVSISSFCHVQYRYYPCDGWLVLCCMIVLHLWRAVPLLH